MRKIKETITALTSGDFPGGVRVKKEEKEPMSDERFQLLSKRAVQIVAMICSTVLIKDSEPLVVFPLSVMAVLVALIYFAFRD